MRCHDETDGGIDAGTGYSCGGGSRHGFNNAKQHEMRVNASPPPASRSNCPDAPEMAGAPGDFIAT